MGKTLYVSDLDGTLLHSDEQISEYSCEVINRLANEGMIFSYATARSVYTSSKATHGLIAKIPLIVYNGAFIVDNETGERIKTNTFTDSEATDIYSVLTQNSIQPIVYALIDNAERFSYIKTKVNTPTAEFIRSREKYNDKRTRPLKSNDNIMAGEKFYFTCIGNEEHLQPAYDKLKEKYNCFFHKDIYSGYQWLEVLPNSATKANAVLQLKRLFDCDKVISFGDAINDIPMFNISDECYAVANADPKLKQIASGIIGTNNDDAVAKFLEQHFGKI